MTNPTASAAGLIAALGLPLDRENAPPAPAYAAAVSLKRKRTENDGGESETARPAKPLSVKEIFSGLVIATQIGSGELYYQLVSQLRIMGKIIGSEGGSRLEALCGLSLIHI